MTEAVSPEYGDPTTAPFWQAAQEHRFLLQRCLVCGRHQHYPRPFCMACMGDIESVDADGRGRVYAVTTVHMPLSELLPAPYVVALVDLVEGPRITVNVLGPAPSIGADVRITWLDRNEAPPLPVVTLE